MHDSTVAGEILTEKIDSEAATSTTGLSVIAGGIWNSFSQALPQGFSLIVSVAAARYLGPSGMGRQSFIAFTMISLSQLISEGLKEALMRSIGEALGADRRGAVRGLARWGLPILVAGGLAGGSMLALAGLLGASPTAAWLLAGVECALISAVGVPWAVLAGSQKWRQASMVGLLTAMVGVPVTVAVLAAGGGITGMFAVEAATAAVALIAMAFLARKTLLDLPRRIDPARDLRRRTASYAILATLMTLATFVVWQRSEFFFLRAYSTDQQIAFYSIAFAAANGLALLPAALAGTLSPAFATLHGARQHQRIRSGYWRAQRLLPIASLPLLAGSLALGPALIRLVYGASYAPAGPVLLILLSLFPLIPLLAVASSLLIGLGSLRVALWCEIAGGAVTIGLNLLLVPAHAAIGAAIADIGGQLVVAVPLLVYAGTHVRPMAIDLPAVGRTVLASAPAGLAAFGLYEQFGGLVGLLVGAVGGTIVFVPLVTLFRVIPSDDRDWVCATVSSRFGERAGHFAKRVVGSVASSSSGPPIAHSGASSGRSGGPACRRLVLYSDSMQRGGAEQALGYLIGGLDWRIAVTVVGVEPAVVSWIASHRPNAEAVLVPAVSNKLRLGAIIAQIRAVRRLRPDVLHAGLNSPWSCQYGILAGLLTPGTRVVVVENALVPSSQPVQRIIKRLISRRVAAHIAVGEWSAREVERLIGMPEGSVRAIRNGVPDVVATPEELPLELERQSSEPSELKVVLGTVSRVSPHKGIELIVRALPHLPHATAVIVGEGPMLAEIRTLASSLGVADRVHTPGFDPNPRRWLTAFDIFVLPTRTETALPLAVVEGMLAGLPVVATDLGSIAESLIDGETGLLVPCDDLNALVGALRLLSEDAPLRERMGVDARALALERFGIVAMVQAYEDLYREVTSRVDLDRRRA
ncbi:MAG TPA: glycosyltransferase [Solirubrobacteraceae bacterium]|nr:glycosyltransferase [Solirubrobacteraceae bacterium]